MPRKQSFLRQHTQKFLQCWIFLLFLNIVNSTPYSLRIKVIEDNTRPASCVSLNWGLKCSSRTRSFHCYNTLNSTYTISSGMSSFRQQFSSNTNLGLMMLLLKIAVKAKNDVLAVWFNIFPLGMAATLFISLSLSLNFAAKWRKVICITCNTPYVNSISHKYILIDIVVSTNSLC